MGTNEKMVFALGANVEVLFQVECVDELTAVRTLSPQVIGHILTLVAGASEFWFIEDIHLVEMLCIK